MDGVDYGVMGMWGGISIKVRVRDDGGEYQFDRAQLHIEYKSNRHFN
jgi:hypothetical protein